MTCKRIQINYSDTPAEELPAEVRSHLEACADCRTYFKQCRDLRALVGFKQYERPAPEVAGRILYKVRTRIDSMESIPRQPSSGLGWRIGLRYSAIAVLAVLVFSNIYLKDNPPERKSGVAEWRTTAEPERGVAQVPLFINSNDPTRVFFDDSLVFGFAPPAASTNVFPVRQPPVSGNGNFQFINFRP